MQVFTRINVSKLSRLTWCQKIPYSIMSQHENEVVTLENIEGAAQQIEQYVHKTPILTSTFMNDLAGRNLYFKCENFQKTGSFKIRGAVNSILKLKKKCEKDVVVVTHSSGNHGQAVAYAASLLGLKSIIVVPSIAPQVKKDAIKGYGAEVVECGPSPKLRHDTAAKLLDNLDGKGEYIPSADHPFVMEGSGSIGLEMLSEIPQLDAAVVPIGTGGVLGGISVACKKLKPDMKVFGAEPELADDAFQSLRTGQRIVFTEYPKTIADGLRMSVGVHTWPVLKENVEDIFTASDEELVRAMFFLWERMKIVVEPSGCIGLAAVLSQRFKALPPEIKNVGIVLSGGNLDLKNIPWVTNF